MSNEAMIQLRQLKMAFGSKVIHDNLDLDVSQGERALHASCKQRVHLFEVYSYQHLKSCNNL